MGHKILFSPGFPIQTQRDSLYHGVGSLKVIGGGGGEGIESYFEPRNKLKPSEFFTKQCQEGTTLGRHRTQRDPKKSSFLVGT